MELMISKLGLSFQPFLLPYAEYEEWMTDSWLKCVREKVDQFRFQVLVHNAPCKFPCNGNNWLMIMFQSLWYQGQQLRALNWVSKHQQVLFLSDVLGARGRNINTRYTRLHTTGEW
jgi:hypothetical protein